MFSPVSSQTWMYKLTRHTNFPTHSPTQVMDLCSSSRVADGYSRYSCTLVSSTYYSPWLDHFWKQFVVLDFISNSNSYFRCNEMGWKKCITHFSFYLKKKKNHLPFFFHFTVMHSFALVSGFFLSTVATCIVGMTNFCEVNDTTQTISYCRNVLVQEEWVLQVNDSI